QFYAHSESDQDFVRPLSLLDDFEGDPRGCARWARAGAERSCEPARHVGIDDTGRARGPDHKLHDRAGQIIRPGGMRCSHGAVESDENFSLVPTRDPMFQDATLKDTNVVLAD